MEQTLEPIKQKTLQQAMRMLDAIGAVYAIKDPTGAMHGTLDLAEKKYKRNLTYTYGAIASYLRPYFEVMEPGKIVHVPVGEFDHETITRSISSVLNKRHGAGSYKTNYNKTTTVVEVLRF